MRLQDFHALGSERSLAKISAVVERNELTPRTYWILGKAFLLLDSGRSQPVDPSRILGYLLEHTIAANNGIVNNCFMIAVDAVRANRATGLLKGQHTSGSVGWANHNINIDFLPDGTSVAVDLTASDNLDHHLRRFDVLGIRGQNPAEVIAEVTELYGGQWELSPISNGGQSSEVPL